MADLASFRPKPQNLDMGPGAAGVAAKASDPVVPVHTVGVPVPGDLPALAVRGSKTHRLHMVFVPGMCVHPGGYVLAFQYAAAAHGDLVAVQGDVSCGGDDSMRRWSNDLVAMDRRSMRRSPRAASDRRVTWC